MPDKNAAKDDISMLDMDLINEITEIFMMHNIETEIIAASIRNPIHVIDCAKAGADIAKFQADYKAVFGE